MAHRKSWQQVLVVLLGVLAACGPPPKKQDAPKATVERNAEAETEARQIQAIADALNEYAPAVHSCWARAATDDFRREHFELLEACGRIEQVISGAQPTTDHVIRRVRRRVTSLLGRLTAHRQRGSDLVYDAYNVDIAAAD